MGNDHRRRQGFSLPLPSQQDRALDSGDSAGWTTDCYVRIRPANTPQTLAFIEKTFKETAPGFPFEYAFLDETIDRLYRTEMQIGDLARAGTALAVFISCLGLFGLASFTASNGQREIGIRKVLGASAAGIASLLTGQFANWVPVANLVAWPVSYFLMRSWLRTFAYRINLGLEVFLLSGALACAVALLAVGFQAVRAARSILSPRINTNKKTPGTSSPRPSASEHPIPRKRTKTLSRAGAVYPASLSKGWHISRIPKILMYLINLGMKGR